MIRSHLKATFWTVSYLIMQIAVMIILALGTILITPEYLETYINGTDKETSMLLLDIIDIITVPTLLITAIILISIFLIYLKITKKTKEIFKPIKTKATLKYIFIAIFANFFIGLLISFLPESAYTESLNNSTNLALTGNFFLVLISTGILIPILEEVIFRFGIGYNLINVNKYYALILQAIVFGIMHGNLIQGIYAFFLGLLFGYTDMKEKSIIPSIIMHITINASSVISVFSPLDETIMLLIISTVALLLYGISIIIDKKKK